MALIHNKSGTIASGKLVKDGELKYTTKGVAYTTFSIPAYQDESQKNEKGYPITKWVNCIAWGNYSSTLVKDAKVMAMGVTKPNLGNDGKTYYTLHVDFLQVMEKLTSYITETYTSEYFDDADEGLPF